MKDTIYAECCERHIPMSNHQSDLYIPVTPETTELVKYYKCCYGTFVNQIDKHLWYDVYFAYIPWWNNRKPK